jgi:aspartyl-tRNA(Asn)/glutamyl-tRNA(Gln) amidotransferase subunit A
MIARTYALTLMTFVWSFAGVPAISVPCGFTEARLPIGLQLIGRRWSEAKLLAAAAEYQAVTAHHLQRPPDWTMRLARVYR